MLLPKTSFIDSYKRVNANSLEDCWSECQKEKTKCQGASYHHKNRTCFLFKSINRETTDAGFTAMKRGNLFFALFCPLYMLSVIGSEKLENVDFEKLTKTRLIGHYKELATDSAENCWIACEEELACNAITFFGAGYLNVNKNCFFYTSKEPAKSQDERFTSIIRKKIGKL